MFERLVDYGDKPGQYVGRLATSWKRISPHVEEYTLRRNVKFSNGDPFTAADVKYSVDYIKDPKNISKQTAYVREIDKVETPDPGTN